MKLMKRGFLLLAASILALTGCAKTSQESSTLTEAAVEAEQTKLNVVATIFPQYDFVREIAGDQVNLSMLLPPGAESHSYEPTPQDIIKIQGSDIFIYVGGESDAWIDTILESVDTSHMKIISLMDLVETVEEELVEGMEEDHSHGTDDFEDSDVQDRPLSDWAGDWQSVYPYLLDGTLTPVMEHKAEESDEKSAAEYYEYYQQGYETDVERIVIDTDSLTFYQNGKASQAKYEYQGYEILTYESGSKGVRYLFEAIGDHTDAPRYLQFSDHLITPTSSEHFHLYWGDDGFDALLAELEHWPTYYPSELDGEEIVAEMLAHGHEEEESEYDEHVWTSPRNAKMIVKALSQELITADPEHANEYQERTQQYVAELDQLDQQFQTVVDQAANKTIVFGDRFPFRYLADAYDLDYFAAFPGCSTETEPSAGTIAFLIDKVKAEDIPVIFHIELSNEAIADTICESTGAKKLLLHTCHNLTRKEFDSGVTYLQLMRDNVKNLKEALQ